MDDDRAMIEKDLEYLEEANQCLHDELEITAKELEEAKVNSEGMEKLLAYFIFSEDPNNRDYIRHMSREFTHRVPGPFEMAKHLGYHAIPGDGGPLTFVKYAIPKQQHMSFRGGGGFPAIPQDTHHTIEMPNLRLEKR